MRFLLRRWRLRQADGVRLRRRLYPTSTRIPGPSMALQQARHSRTRNFPFHRHFRITIRITEAKNDHGPCWGPHCKSFIVNNFCSVGATGFEPATSWSRTNALARLSYAPKSTLLRFPRKHFRRRTACDAIALLPSRATPLQTTGRLATTVPTPKRGNRSQARHPRAFVISISASPGIVNRTNPWSGRPFPNRSM